MRFLQINRENIDFLEEFLSEIGSSSQTFRYYNNKEPKNVIENHLVTLLLYDGGPVGYGHLDKEKGNVWLGICIKDDKTGNGYGNIMMEKLVNYYNGKINLSVDFQNERAIKLYKKFSFVEYKKANGTIFMTRE